MLRSTSLIILNTAIISILFSAAPSLAQVRPIVQDDCGFFGRNCSGAEDFAGIGDYLVDVILIFVGLIGVIAFAFLVYAGFKYVTSFGSPEPISTAKHQIAYAMLGIIVAVFATSFIALVAPSQVPSGLPASPIDLVILDYINIALTVIGVVAAAFIVYGGFRYVSSYGDQDTANTAKKIITWAVFGVIIAFGAEAIIQAVYPLAAGGQTSQPLINYIDRFIQIGLALVGIVSAGYLLYAGFKYITSRGDESEAATAKNQIIYAVIGIIIAGLAYVIRDAVITSALGAPNLVPLTGRIRIIVNAFLALAGTVAAIYMLLAGVLYITSQGDEDQARRAKMQVIYGIAGIIVIILSGVIVNFVINAVS